MLTEKFVNRSRGNIYFLDQQFLFTQTEEVVTFGSHNFVNNGPFLTKLVPIDRSSSGLFSGANFVKNGPLSTKLLDPKVVNILTFIFSVKNFC